MQSLKNLVIPAKQGTTNTSAEKPLRFIMNVPHTVVIGELIALAGKYAGVATRYEEDRHSRDREGAVFVAECSEEKLFRFSNELRRLQDLITKPLDEPIMEDHEPVTQGYMYVADGKPRMFIDGINMTVGRWKALSGGLAVKEVRSCDIVGRQLRLPPDANDKQFDPALRPGRWDASGHTIRQAKRRPRSSHKIKKVS